MTEQKEVAKETIKVTNTGKASHVLFGADGKQHVVGPGQELEVEVAEPHAKQLQEASKGGSGLTVSGHEPEKEERPEGAPEVTEESTDRTKMAKKEAELMKAGQEADKGRREKDAKKPGLKRAAETGIAMFARGEEPEVVAAPPDAPPETEKK
jgi:hypothetical protein